MKIVIVPETREEAKYFCDKHPQRECFTEVSTMCWYGSSFDGVNLNANLCDECLEKFYAYMKKTFGAEPVEKDSFL